MNHSFFQSIKQFRQVSIKQLRHILKKHANADVVIANADAVARKIHFTKRWWFSLVKRVLKFQNRKAFEIVGIERNLTKYFFGIQMQNASYRQQKVAFSLRLPD